MENVTNFNQSASFIFRPNIWLLDAVINGILVVISLYLLLALLFHELKIEPPRKERFLRLSTENKYRVLSKYTCILIAVASVLRQSITFGSLWLDLYVVKYNLSLSQETMIETACKALSPLSNFALTIGIGLVYQFLWFRQRVFYIHPSLKMLSHSCLKFFSFGVIILWILFYIALYPAYFALVHYRFVAKIGCLIETSSADFYSSLIITWGAMSILVQLALLFLFIYPIVKRTLWGGHPKNEQNTCLMKRVKKAVILTLICLVTDILSVLASEFLSTKNTSSITFDFGVNLVINHLVTIACFDYWKQLLWPWNLKSKIRSRYLSKDVTTNFTEVNLHPTHNSSSATTKNFSADED